MTTTSRTPSSTYRLQLHADFPFAAAEAMVPYIASLGVSHLYLSPILQAAPGSMHGYDVVDHSRVSDDLGGAAALRSLARVARQQGLGIVVDVVPNHMAIPTPASLNPQFWDLLRKGRDSAYAHWFDIDWELCGGRLGLPVLGETVDEAIDAGALAIDEHEGEQVVRYRGGQVFPIADGMSGGSVADVLGRQRYLLASWREKARTLGYRRFFDVDTLIAVQIDHPDVFEATHRVLLALHADGVVDGFRIDHPDGLSDPEAYLARLREATHDAWAVVEKVLSVGEGLPSSWQCDGTTGYDAVEAVQAALAPPTGRELDTVWRLQDGAAATLDDVELAAKRQVVDELLQPELLRLSRRAREAAGARGIDADEQPLASAFAAVLEHIDAYRAYVRLDEPVDVESARRLDAWCDRAAVAYPESAGDIRLVRELVGDSETSDPATRDLVVRFQQVCGPVMAKGVEDTTFYRWNKLISLNEVGGDPSSIDDPDPTLRLDRWADRQARDRPHGMTALSTHDTKRDEDVRARISTAAEWPERWTEVSTAMQATAAALGIDRPTAYLLMQTVVGAWPITGERLLDYIVKAAREAKAQTTWTNPDERYEAALGDLVRSVVRPGDVHSLISRWVAELDEPAAATDLASKLIQLTLPGVPDIYQGCDAVSRSLVDPDNRRPVDYAARRERLRMLDEGDAARDLGDRKLLVTSRVLRLRRARPDLFDASAGYGRLDTGTAHALAFQRGDDLLTIVTRWPLTLGLRGGWANAGLRLPSGRWRDVLTDRKPLSADVSYAELFAALPVALLARDAAVRSVV